MVKRNVRLTMRVWTFWVLSAACGPHSALVVRTLAQCTCSWSLYMSDDKKKYHYAVNLFFIGVEIQQNLPYFWNTKTHRINFPVPFVSDLKGTCDIIIITHKNPDVLLFFHHMWWKINTIWKMHACIRILFDLEE